MSDVAPTKPKLLGIISLVLMIAFAISLAKLMWLILTPEQKIQTQVSHINSTTSNTQIKKKNYGRIIAQQHLFGEVKKVASTPTTVKPVAPMKAPPKKLNLKLHGIVSYKSNNGGYALISSAGGIQKVFGKDDEIEENVKLKKILATKVIVSNNGQDEELLLPRKDVSVSASISPANLPNGDIPAQSNQNMRPPDSGPMPDLGMLREEVRSNPRMLMDVATPSPAIIDGKFIGFRVQPGPRRKLFRQLGFRPNDIITEVNGIIIDDASKGAQILSELSQASNVSVTVKRGDQEHFIQHSF